MEEPMTLLMAMLVILGPVQQQASPDPTMASNRATYDMVQGWLLKAAEQVPEEHYAFRPTPEVRSLGELFGHVADANFMICSVASGDKAPTTSVEKTKTTKADLRAALAESFKFCDAAFDGLTAARAAETVKFFVPGTYTRQGVLGFNTAHDFEHYGNVVTYMRLKGMVPPSSAGRPGQ
jgi:uncharacterized damage-inducible protein DinB